MELAALVGSEKQVAWAQKERAKVIEAMERHLEADLANAAEPRYSYETDEQWAKKQARLAATVERTQSAIAAAAALTSARVWIDLLRTQETDRVIKILTTDEGRAALKKYT